MNDVFLGLADMVNPPDNYDKYIWSGDGCVKGIRWCVNNNKTYDIIPNPWVQETTVNKAIEYLKYIREQVLKALKKELGEYLDIRYEDDEWFILLSTWLREYLTSSYDKYIRLQMISNMDESMDCYVYNTNCGEPQADHADFFELSLSNDNYNMFLYSELMSGLSNGLENVNCIEVERGIDSFQVNIPPLKYNRMQTYLMRTSNIMTYIWHFFVRNYTVINMKSTGIGCWLLLKLSFSQGMSLLPAFTMYKENKYRIIRDSIDNKWRNKPLSIDSKGDIFLELISKTIKKEIPIAYVEGHRALLEHVNRHFEIIDHAKAYLSGAAFVYDELDRLLLLKARRNDKLLCGFQHGGNYGTERYWLHEDEFQIYDRYYTWGWNREKRSKKFIPMPSFFFMRSHKFASHDTDQILYVNYSSGRYMSRFCRLANRINEINDGEMTFLKSLSEDLLRRIIVRLFPCDYGWSRKETMRREIPNIRFDEEPRLHASASRVSLVITSDWQTVFIEMLALGKPVLVLCNGSYIVDDAKSDVQLLQEVGIAHKDWESIKCKIEQIDGRVQEWWEELQRQIVIDRIKTKYAFMMKCADRKWVSELKKTRSQI